MLSVGNAKNSRSKYISALAVAALVLLPIFYNSCASQMRSILGSSGTRTGSPLVEVFFQPYVDGPSFENLKMCLEMLQLYSSDTEYVDVVIPNAEVAIIETGISVGTLALPKGTFSKAKLRLGAGCTSSTSLSFDNGDGSFSTSESIDLTFNGSMTVSGESARLSFDIQNLLNELILVTANSEIFNAATNAIGGFTYGEYGTVLWTGNGSDSNWSNTNNWRENRVPGIGDIAVFDDSCTNCNPVLDVPVNVGGLLLKDVFPGIINQMRPLSVGINIRIYGGEIQGVSGANVSIGGDLIIMGTGSFRTGSQDINLSGNLYVESTFSGPANINFEGFNSQDVTIPAVFLPTGNFAINKTGFGWVNLKSILQIDSPGQNLTVTEGNLNVDFHKLIVGGSLEVNSHIHLRGDARVAFGSLVLGPNSQVNYFGSDPYTTLPLGLAYAGNLNFYGGSWIIPGSITAKSLTIGGGVTIYTGGFDLTVTKFWNSGTWNHGASGSLIFEAGESYIQLGTATAYNVVKITQGDLSVVDHLTADNSITIQGTPGGMIELRSIEPGVRKNIVIGGTYSFTNLIVRDSQYSGAGPIVVTGQNCIDGGNNLGWTF